MSHEPEPTPAQLQARSRAQELASAFETVFGQVNRRSAQQKLVIAHLGTQAAEDSPSYQFNNNQDGLKCIAAGIHRDGAKLMLLNIDKQLAIALKNKQPKSAKPKTVR